MKYKGKNMSVFRIRQLQKAIGNRKHTRFLALHPNNFKQLVDTGVITEEGVWK